MKTPNLEKTDFDDKENTSASGLSPSDLEASELVARYKPLVYAIASRYRGMEFDDLTQEGMLGLLNAAKRFDPSRGSSFGSFASLCIHRRLSSAVARQQGKRREEISISQLSPQEEEAFAKLTALSGDSINNPENLIIRRENFAEWIEMLDTLLSPREQQIVYLYLEGYSYQAIAQKLTIPVKSVDNGLQRIRRKVRESVLQDKESE